MAFTFVDNLPDEIQLEPTLISGSDSIHLNGRAYVILHQDGIQYHCYEIRYAYHCSPFKEAIIVDNLLAVGHENSFYLFDLISNTNVLTLETEGYFGNINVHDSRFYIADSCGLFCIDKSAAIIWQNKQLGIDGVIINTFENNKIFGSGEWDPPGGWRNFILDKFTGVKINPLSS